MIQKKIKPISKVVINCAIIVTILVNLITLIIMNSYVSNKVYSLESKHISEIVSNITNHTTTTLDKYAVITTILAENTLISDLLLVSDKEIPMHQQPNVGEVISELNRISNHFEGIVINFGILDVEQDGFLTESGGYSFTDFSFKERLYYPAVMNQESVITSPYYDYFTSNMVISVVSPVVRNNQVLGAVLIDLSMAFITDMVIASNHGETGSSFIIDENGIILAHQNADYIGQNYEILNLVGDQLANEFKNPTNTLIEYTKNDVEKIGLVGNIGDFGWQMLTFMDLEEFNKDISTIINVLMLLLILSTFVILRILYVLLSNWLNPVGEIKFAMEQLAQGNVKYNLDYSSNNEIGDLADNVRIATNNLATHIEHMQYQLDYDQLTGLYSLRKFIFEAKKKLKENPDTQYAILSFDIDNFKHINETYSFETGSKLLKEMSLTFKRNLDSDILISRSNSDNFIFMLKESQMKNFKRGKNGDIKYFIADTEAVLGEYYELNFSVGIYMVEHKEKTVAWMIDCASYARAYAKQVLGFSVERYSEEMHKLRENSNYITEKMQDAIAEKEFIVYYQPKFDLTTSQIMGAEALVRWKHNDKIIYPNDFIPVFEQNGFIETLDYYIIDSVCQMIIENQDKYHLPIISINLSGITVIKKDVVEKVCSICEKYGVLSKQIELEITESAFVEHFDLANARIDEFRELGFQVSMDDFGSGISSLGRLKNMMIDVLKIDREFIIESFENERAGTIVRHIVDMSKALDLKTVVEGVETPEQLHFLRDVGCDLGQGYIFARPLPQKEFLDLL